MLFNVRNGGRNKLFPADTPEQAVKKFEKWAEDYPPVKNGDGEVVKPVAARVRDLGGSEPSEGPPPELSSGFQPLKPPGKSVLPKGGPDPPGPKPKGGKPK